MFLKITRRHPLLAPGLVYAAGIVLGHYWAAPLVWLFAATGFALALALGRRDRTWWLLALTFFLAGSTNLVWRTATLSPLDLRAVIGDRIELVTVRGRLVETPSPRVLLRDDEENWRSVATLAVERLRRGPEWQAVTGQVAVSTRGILPAGFYAGCAVEVTGVLRPPKGPVAEGLFDYREYLQWLGIAHELRAQATNDWALVRALGQPTRPLADRFLAWAQQALARGLPVEDEPLRLLWAMTLGWKTALTDTVSEPFMQTGTMHIFAISGLHIALIAGILVALLRVLQVPRGACGWVVAPLIWFYTMATGWQSSAIRSTIMMTVVILGWTLRRPGDLLNSLTASGFIILLWDPRQLFQASFQLSFLVVLSIALLLPPLETALRPLWQTDPLLPADLAPRWRRWLGHGLRWLTSSLATSLAACLGSLPLIAYYFHMVSPVSLLANLVVVPLSSVALMSNLGSLACSGWLPTWAEWLNHTAWLCMTAMVRWCEWSASWRGAWLNVRPPGTLAILVYCAVLVGVFSGWLLARARRRWAALTGGVLLGGWAAMAWLRPAETRLTVLALNGGSAVWAEAPGGANHLLVDCGNAESAEFIVKPFLQAQGVNRLPWLLLSHGDLRHVGGTDLIASRFRAAKIALGPVRSRSPAYRRLWDQVQQAPARWAILRRGDQVAGWKVLHPGPEDRFSRADDNCLVLRGEFQGCRVVLLADLGKAGQQALVKSGVDLTADIVVTGIPAGAQALGDPLLEAIRPRAIIVNDATFPVTERAGTALRERLATRRLPIVYTSQNGSATVTIDRHGWVIRTMDGRTVRGEVARASTRGG